MTWSSLETKCFTTRVNRGSQPDDTSEVENAPCFMRVPVLEEKTKRDMHNQIAFR